jgi:hypothetical protein
VACARSGSKRPSAHARDTDRLTHRSMSGDAGLMPASPLLSHRAIPAQALPDRWCTISMMVMRAQGAIGHLDADCFYVSAERVRNFLLRENPVGVLGNQGACVIAKSYEMKATGVKTGIPIWDALKLCPNGIYVKRDFRWYEVLSRLMLECV